MKLLFVEHAHVVILCREGRRMANERFIESNGYNGWMARRPGPVEQFVNLYNYIV